MTITLLDFASGDVTVKDNSPSFDTTDGCVPAILRSLPPTAVVTQRRAYSAGKRKLTVASLLKEYDSGLGAWGW